MAATSPVGNVQGNSTNTTNAHHIHTRSTISSDLSYRLANTLRFGEYTPTFVMEGVETDQIPLYTSDSIDSLSLDAPLKGQVRKIKESFMVPDMAILPFAWDRIYVQPSSGDDVPQDANCVITNFQADISAVINSVWTTMGSSANIPSSPSASNVGAWYTAALRALVLTEYFYSHGSLLNVMGYKLASHCFCYKDGVNGTVFFDTVFDDFITTLFSPVFKITVSIPGSTQPRIFNGLSPDAQTGVSVRDYAPFRALLELFRENPACSITSVVNAAGTWSDISSAMTTAAGMFRLTPLIEIPAVNSADELASDVTALQPGALNYKRLAAYQMVCWHYYSNSRLDALYTADLYRQYFSNLFSNMIDRQASSVSASVLSAATHYSYNGMSLPYDWLSGHLYGLLSMYSFANLTTPTPITPSYTSLSASIDNVLDIFPYRMAAFAALFSFRRSLRYNDYFVGSRPRPLAPINTDVAVDQNMVSVIDITRSIQAQRFGNSIMRTGSKIENYVKSITGRAPSPDYHNPFFLTRETETIFGDEVQNTGEAQTTEAQSRTATLRSNAGRYHYTFHNDDRHTCTYMQIVHFDFPRFYCSTIERQFLHIDRFDMFNPDFQFIGDQPVYGVELGYGNGASIPLTFGYQTRDMEYKQRFDQAAGGFVNNLPGWILTDNIQRSMQITSLDSDFIRSYNSEFDQFYLALTGYSLGTYFHFIMITNNNVVDAKRMMALDPQILA